MATLTFSQSVNGAARQVPAWPIYVAGFAWMGWLFYTAATGAIGPEPVNLLERAYGEVALQLLVAGLILTPLRRWTGVNLIKYRRALGLMAFAFVVAHFLVWLILDLQNLAFAWAEIVKRPYITVGMVGLVLMIPLALTSNNAAIRRIGPVAWRNLHSLTYPILVLGLVHYIWLTKGFPYEPLVYAAVTFALLAVRWAWQLRRARA